MYTNLQKREFKDVEYFKPPTPVRYLQVKEEQKKKVHKVVLKRKMIKEDKILSPTFAAISRDERQVNF